MCKQMEDIDDPTAVLRAEMKDKEEEVLAARRSLADTSLDLKRAQLEIERSGTTILLGN